MTIADYFQTLRNKWTIVSLRTGTGSSISGVITDVGEDYLLLLVTEKEKPHMIPFSAIAYAKEMNINANGKPKLFG